MSELPWWATLPASLLLVLGGLLSLLGSVGLLRFNEFQARMHSPAMVATLGTGCVLVASMLVSSALLQRPVFHELVITVFVVVSAPVSGMLLMRAAVERGHRHRSRAGSVQPPDPQ